MNHALLHSAFHLWKLPPEIPPLISDEDDRCCCHWVSDFGASCRPYMLMVAVGRSSSFSLAIPRYARRICWLKVHPLQACCSTTYAVLYLTKEALLCRYHTNTPIGSISMVGWLPTCSSFFFFHASVCFVCALLFAFNFTNNQSEKAYFLKSKTPPYLYTLHRQEWRLSVGRNLTTGTTQPGSTMFWRMSTSRRRVMRWCCGNNKL